MKNDTSAARTFWPSLKNRSYDAEIMDNFTGDEGVLHRTLKQFAPINRLVSRSRHLLESVFLRDAHDRGADTFTILDVGAGGCDLMMALSRRATALGMDARITCADYDPRAVRYAREATRDYANIRVVEADIFDAELGTFDYVFCNHLLHHFTDEQVLAFVRQVETMAEHRYVINDIRRGRFAYLGITLLAGLIFPNSLSFHDGRTSVRRSFRPEELEHLIAREWPEKHKRPAIRTLAPARIVMEGGGE